MSKTITIAGHLFEVSTPYAEGHTCTEAEAKALNQTRAENVRNNMARKVKDAQDADGNIPENVLADLAAEVAKYDAEYEFTLASVGGGATRTLDPIEREARSIARDALRANLKEQGRKILAKGKEPESDSDVTKEQFDNAVAKLAEQDNIVKLAKKKVSEKQKVAEEIGSI